MLKPWIIHILLWIFKTGLATGPILSVWFRFARPASRPQGLVAIAILWVTVAVTGWILDFVVTTISYTVLCGFFVGILAPINRNKPATLLIAVPLAAGFAFVALIYSDAVADSNNPLVPTYEQRLNAQLICRGYPKWNDSLPATRLTLLRETNGLKDDVLANLDGYYRTDCMSCAITQIGRVHMHLSSCDGNWKLNKEVPVGVTAFVNGNRGERILRE